MKARKHLRKSILFLCVFVLNMALGHALVSLLSSNASPGMRIEIAPDSDSTYQHEVSNGVIKSTLSSHVNKGHDTVLK